MDTEDLKVPVGKTVLLKDYDSCLIPNWFQKIEEKEGKKAAKEQALKLIDANSQKLVELQELFWASNTYSMLIILQGMDAAGKAVSYTHLTLPTNREV